MTGSMYCFSNYGKSFSYSVISDKFDQNETEKWLSKQCKDQLVKVFRLLMKKSYTFSSEFFEIIMHLIQKQISITWMKNGNSTCALT